MAEKQKVYRVIAKSRIIDAGVVYDRGDRFTITQAQFDRINDLVLVTGESMEDVKERTPPKPAAPQADRMVRPAANRAL
jgi:hypothetical protein